MSFSHGHSLRTFDFSEMSWVQIKAIELPKKYTCELVLYSIVYHKMSKIKHL